MAPKAAPAKAPPKAPAKPAAAPAKGAPAASAKGAPAPAKGAPAAKGTPAAEKKKPEEPVPVDDDEAIIMNAILFALIFFTFSIQISANRYL